jgi:hypothetical protein
MLIYLLGAVALGIGTAGVVMIAFRLVGRKAPRWSLPAFAGLAMLGFHVWSDLTWFQRTEAALPAHLFVAGTYTSTTPLQPWTYLKPRIDRFSVVNDRTVQRNERVPHLRLAEVFLVVRYMPTISTMQIYDCEAPRRSDVVQTLEFDAAGQPIGVQWVAVDPADPIRQKVCASTT